MDGLIIVVKMKLIIKILQIINKFILKKIDNIEFIKGSIFAINENFYI